MQGDHSAGCKTLPIEIGRERTHFIVQGIIILSLLSVLICSLMFFDSYFATLFFGLGEGSPLLFVAYKVRKVRMSTNYHLLSQLLKLSMLIGLLLLILLPQILSI
jgi:4-hydroxybenzoate polyprenyltransferase